MKRKRIFQKEGFKLTYTTREWEWYSFMRIVEREHMEDLIWYGLPCLDDDWEKFLRNWMQVEGDFFVGWHDAGIAGACWVTDIEGGVGKFHLVTFPWGEHLMRNIAALAVKRILAFGLDKRHGPCYRYLIGETPFLPLARMARIYGLGDYEKVEGLFGEAPGYQIRINPK